ncbi:hypothetical protein PIROE2DRAFT_7266 [Piromyces sp. E2]|nr:hypothetical protein PIROE2DRAFT_7266 [Piromyces sp. E2]|eukprot:OUM65682.1 hypothetical protein PIROE2DRAFT_7266 [Piromyces sp. E2]
MKKSLIVRLFSIIAVAASTYANPLLKKHPKHNSVTLAKDADVNYYKNVLLDKPVVVYIYGGGWSSGDKEKNAKIGELLRDNGYISVVPNYHVHPNTTSIETMVDEVYHALQWTYKNIHKYGGDKKRITVSGHSAGAHLIALTFTKSTLGLKNLDKPLKKLPVYKHALLLNGPYVVGDIEESIKNFIAYGIIPYAEAFKDLFLNKTGYNPQDILITRKNKSIKTLGAKHVTFLECTEDTLVPLGSADPMIEQVKRTVRKISVDHAIIEGDHNKITHGIREGDEEAKKIFIDSVKKYNKP